jgi:hypothetical protein
VEQKPADWSKAASKAKENLGHSDRLQLAHRIQNRDLFNLGIDSKLRGCDLVKLNVGNSTLGSRILPRATFFQQKPISLFGLSN